MPARAEISRIVIWSNAVSLSSSSSAPHKALRDELGADWRVLAQHGALAPSERLITLAGELGFRHVWRAESAARGHVLAAVRRLIAGDAGSGVRDHFEAKLPNMDGSE